jgi:hypothetical protein
MSPTTNPVRFEDILHAGATAKVFTNAHELGLALGFYSHCMFSEPVLELVDPGNAWVVETEHGPTLVSRNMAMWDLDCRPKDREEQAQQIAAISEALKGDQSFRLYRTWGGYRLLCVSRKAEEMVLACDLPDFYGHVCQLLHHAIPGCVDVRYVLMAQLRQVFHMRLLAKSPDHPSREGATPAEGPSCACKWVASIGGKLPLPEIYPQLALHDERTGSNQALSMF